MSTLMYTIHQQDSKAIRALVAASQIMLDLNQPLRAQLCWVLRTCARRTGSATLRTQLQAYLGLLR